MIWILSIIMCVLPFSDIFLRVRDMWLSQGAFLQIGVLCAFAYSLIKHGNYRVKNIPLAVLTLWLGVMTWIFWNDAVRQSLYNFIVFMPFFNFLTLVIFYKCITDYLTEFDIQRIVRYFSYAIILLLGYCVLQFFNLDQFHNHFSPGNLPDPVIGTMGNTSHLASYLSMCLPVLYYRNLKLPVILCWIWIIYLNSVVGLASAVIVSLFYMCFSKDKLRNLSISAIAIVLSLGVIGYFRRAELLSFLNPEGRLDYWQKLYPIFAQAPITGSGFGKILSLDQHWKHAHNEYYQLAVENGLIALGIVIWGIKEFFVKFWGMRANKLAVCSCAVFIAFLTNSLLNFTAHMWLTSTLGMFSYASLYTLKGDTL